MTETDRIYRYKTLLSHRRVMTAEDLMAAQEVSRATLKRDIAKMRDRLGTPIIFDREVGGYRLSAEQGATELPGMWFSQGEILALMTIQSMIEQLEPGLIGPKLKPLQKRLDDLLSQQGLDPQLLTQRVRAVHAGKRQMKLAAFEAVAKATFERKQIDILYNNRQRKEKIQRVISPQQLVHYRDNWYVDAWCHLRNEVRSFSIDAILATQALDKPAKDVDLDALRKKLSGGYGIFGGEPKDVAVLKFSPIRAEWVQAEIWHPDQAGVVNTDETYTLRVPYSDERELLGDILRFGPEVEITSPASLRKRLRQEILKMQALYEPKD
jgi:predicted DNA-binding transcriptional regulator YafY